MIRTNLGYLISLAMWTIIASLWGMNAYLNIFIKQGTDPLDLFFGGIGLIFCVLALRNEFKLDRLEAGIIAQWKKENNV